MRMIRGGFSTVEQAARTCGVSLVMLQAQFTSADRVRLITARHACTRRRNTRRPMHLITAALEAFQRVPCFVAGAAELTVSGRRQLLMFCISFALSLVAPATHAANAIAGVARDERVETRGFATYYASRFDGRRTASGTTFRNNTLTAAHPTLPFGTLVRVTNLPRTKSVVVQVVDRGPGVGPLNKGVIIDLSQLAAERLNMLRHGRVRVRVEVLASEHSSVASHTPLTPQLRPAFLLRLDTTLASSRSVLPAHAHCEAAQCSTPSAGVQLQLAYAGN